CLSVEKAGTINFQDATTVWDSTKWRIGMGTSSGGLWLLANFAYTGMRAQGNQGSPGWRVLAFIFGFPGTLLSWLVVLEGSERAYGVDLPRRVRQATVQNLPGSQEKPVPRRLT